MGRHSDPDPRWFWLSLAAAAAKAALAVAVLGVAVFGVLRVLGGPADDETDVAASATTETEPAEPGVESLPAEPEESPEPAPTAFRSPGEDSGKDADDADGGDDGPVLGTVQVLNASGDARALRDAIETLEELGYQVVAEGRAARGYERTTVFWSAGFRDEAESLQEANDRFAVIQRNDRLDATINLHVVVGRDWIASG